MKPTEKNFSLPAKLFKWLDKDNIVFVNKEGIEKLVDISNEDCKEISYNVVPQFNEDNIDSYKHFYYDRESLEPDNTYRRLVMKI
jgi:hypothetical protein